MNNNELNQNVINRLYSRIRILESQNIKTKKYSDKDIIKIMTKLIQTEVEGELNENK